MTADDAQKLASNMGVSGCNEHWHSHVVLCSVSSSARSSHLLH